MKKVFTINVARDFSPLPGNRYKAFGPYSGEEFRESLLIPHLQNNELVVVELDGARGYGSNFLDEAFGGAILKLNIKPDEIKDHIQIKSSITRWKNQVLGYMQEKAQCNHAAS
jgi:STAS-like domain of unknown function (DUF4325)